MLRGRIFTFLRCELVPGAAAAVRGRPRQAAEERDDDYKEFRDKLIDAYDILFKQNQISWLH